MSKTDGGPAFPVDGVSPIGGISFIKSTGLSVRDWFAGQALTGIIGQMNGTLRDVNNIAPAAYNVADAMLREREADHE